MFLRLKQHFNNLNKTLLQNKRSDATLLIKNFKLAILNLSQDGNWLQLLLFRGLCNYNLAIAQDGYQQIIYQNKNEEL